VAWSICLSIRPSCAPTSIPQASRESRLPGNQPIKGGLMTKLPVAASALGNPLRVILSAGQIADIECVAKPSSRTRATDADYFIATIEAAEARTA
jgi:hypothetical protein